MAVSEMDIHEQNLSPRESKSRRIRWTRLLVLALCIGASVLWGNKLAADQGGLPGFDFEELYYGARCAIVHQDPYQPNVVDAVFQHEGGVYPHRDRRAEVIAPIVIKIDVYLPTVLLLIAPLGHLSYAAAHQLWLLLTAILLGTAGYLMWSLGDPDGPVLSGWLIAIMLADCQMMFMAANAAGLVVALTVIACWCFMQDRWGALGVALLAMSLAVKPHDVGFIWLFFLLSGGLLRKRALQTLAVTMVIGVAAAVWIAPVAPHWLHELRQNHIVVSAAGGTSDPTLAGMTSGGVGSIIDLQAALSMLFASPEAYNSAAYLILAPLFAACMWIAWRRRNSAQNQWVGLAAIAVLSLLPVYHRPYDAKLLLLAVPACAQLWRHGGARRWCSMGLTIAAVLSTSDLPRAVFMCLFEKPTVYGPQSAALTAVAPAVLLATACFYLWAYVRADRGDAAAVEFVPAELKPLSSET